MVRLAFAVAALALASLALQPVVSAESAVPAAQVQQNVVYVTGAVSQPGRYPWTSEMTLLQLLAASGGLLPGADTRLFVLSATERDQNGQPLMHAANYRDALSGKELLKNNPRLKPGDTVFVGVAAARASGSDQPGVPAADDYAIGPRDVLVLTVFGDATMSGDVVVGADGMIELWSVKVKAQGLRVADLRKQIATELGKYYVVPPPVVISVKEISSRSKAGLLVRP